MSNSRSVLARLANIPGEYRDSERDLLVTIKLMSSGEYNRAQQTLMDAIVRMALMTSEYRDSIVDIYESYLLDNSIQFYCEVTNKLGVGYIDLTTGKVTIE